MDLALEPTKIVELPVPYKQFIDLPNELIKTILDFVEPDSEHAIPVDRRQFLSEESIGPPPPDYDFVQRVGSLRCVCSHFARAGAPILFTRVAARFSQIGLERIEMLAEWPELAGHVQKFSYMLPYFFTDEDFVLPATDRRLQQRIDEQRQIVDRNEDVRVLTKVFSKFTALKAVQILRVTDQNDRDMVACIHRHEDARPWARAYSHGSRTVGRAILASDLRSIRFSSPMLSPQSVESLAASGPPSLYDLASRLTCLTLHFDHVSADLDKSISDLSPRFHAVFAAARNLQVVHVGFPGDRPLDRPLVEVFHNIKWDQLKSFGIQGWRLKGDEIIDLAMRHQDRLTGLRLRDVHLKEGPRWRDILIKLRERMHSLNWVSLRRIGYEKHFLDMPPAFEALDQYEDGPAGSTSESESDDDDDYDDIDDAIDGEDQRRDSSSSRSMNVDQDWDDDERDSDLDSGSENGAANNGVDIPVVDFANTPASSFTWCNCDRNDSLNDMRNLDDDGVYVSNTTRKAWENWVVRRCPEHNERT